MSVWYQWGFGLQRGLECAPHQSTAASTTPSPQRLHPDGAAELRLWVSKVTTETRWPTCTSSLRAPSQTHHITPTLSTPLTVIGFSSTTQAPGLPLAFLPLVSTSQSLAEFRTFDCYNLCSICLYYFFSVKALISHTSLGGVFFSLLFLLLYINYRIISQKTT